MVLTGRFTWSQSVEEVLLTIPLKGSSLSSLDIYASKLYVKINFRPYLINIDFFGKVDYNSMVSKVEMGTLLLRFLKLAPEMWPDISFTGDAAAMRLRRTASIEERQKEDKDNASKNAERKQQDEKMSTRLQMQTDEIKRQHLEDLKVEEKKLAEASVYETFKAMEQEISLKSALSEEKNLVATETCLKSALGGDEKDLVATEARLKSASSEEKNVGATGSILIKGNEPKKERRVSFSDEISKKMPLSDQVNHQLPAKKVLAKKQPVQETPGDNLDKCIPQPRIIGTVKVAFTPRVFPSPMRESKKEEEEDWLLRNRRHLKGPAKKRLDSIDISDSDPYWLKGKGDDFFRAGNSQGAINAYTCALEIDETITPCFSNRAACYLKLKQYDLCIEDCDRALASIKQDREEELKAETPQKELKRVRDMRKKLMIRKGTALKGMENFNEALLQYQLACELDEFNETLKADCARIALLVQCAAEKDLGDESFRAQEYQIAIKHYSKGLEANPESAPCLANRCICNQKLGLFEDAIKDATNALKIIESEEWKMKILNRLALLYIELNQESRAKECLLGVLDLNPADLAVAKQLKMLELKN